MIQVGTILDVADNSGARKVQCIKVPGSAAKRYAYIGEVVIVAVKEALPTGKVKQGEVQHALIVRTKKGIKRKDGSCIRFDSNAAVLVDGQKEPIGTRIFGPVTRELRAAGCVKVMSLAPEVL